MKKAAQFLTLLLLSGFTFAQTECLLDRKDIPAKLVNDYADILSSGEEAQLEQKLVEFDRSTTTQIAVVTVTDLCGYDKAEFTYSLGEKWKVGRKGFDNGIVLMVKPTGGQGQRHTFIAVGYGLEGIIPDATAKRIVEVEMIPEFKNDRFYQGIDHAVNTLMSLALKEFSAKDYEKKTGSGGSILPFLFVIIIGLIVLLSRVKQIKSYSVGHDIPFWTAFWLLSNSHHRRSHGGWGNFNSGGGSFGGFGGGSFGGGGAGGNW